MPDHPRRCGDAHQEQHGPGGKQEAQKPHQQAHYRSSVPALFAVTGGAIWRYPQLSSIVTRQWIKWQTISAIYFRDSGHLAVVYKAAAVAKLGLGSRLPVSSHFAGPAVASRLARNTSIACAIAPTVRSRQVSETRCSRSLLFET